MQIRPLDKKLPEENLSRKKLMENTQLLAFSELLAHPCHDLEKLEGLRSKLTRPRWGKIAVLRSLIGGLIGDVREADAQKETAANLAPCNGYRVSFKGHELCGGHISFVCRGSEGDWQSSSRTWHYPKTVDKQTIIQILDIANDPACAGLTAKIEKAVKVSTPKIDLDKVLSLALDYLPKVKDTACIFTSALEYNTAGGWFKDAARALLLNRRDEVNNLLNIHMGHLNSDEHFSYTVTSTLMNHVSKVVCEKLMRTVLHEFAIAIAAKREELKKSPELQEALYTKKQIAKTDVILEVLSDLQKTKKAIDAIVRAIEIDSMTEETLDAFRNQAYVLGRNSAQHGIKLRKHYITPFKKKK